MGGRRVVVSGGGTGIGLATAEAFAADGDRVVLLGRREDVLRKAADGLNERHGPATASWYAADLADPEQVEAAREFIVRDDTPVDVLVANAGGNASVPHDGGLASVAESYRRNFDANVLTAVLLTEALLPHVRRPGGRIVQLSSIASLRGPGSYGGSKGWINTYTYDLAQRVGSEGITVNAVAPGFVGDTEFFGDRATPEFVAARVGQSLTGRPGRPDQIAAFVRYVASPEAAYVTGQLLHINGGAALGR
jgi:3-oxoacyl-[acyl-carrier protein] reductase